MAAVATSQVTVGTAAVMLCKADVDGCRVTLHTDTNHGVVIGGDDSVTDSTGLGLHDGLYLQLALPPSAEIWSIRTGVQDVLVYVMTVSNDK